jgi:uncharacterized protein
VKDEDGKNGYIFYVTRNHVIDARKTLKALARYANDARGLVKIKGVTNNCDYITDGLKAYIESKKDIPAGAEIFVDYGKDYWKVIRTNMKLWKQEAKELEQEKNNNKMNGTTLKNGHKRNGKVVRSGKASRKLYTKTAKRMQH